MKNCHSNNTRLYITQDINSTAYFVRTDVEKFARFHRDEYGWMIWIYPYKYNLRTDSLTKTLKIMDKLFKKYWNSKYGELK